MICEWLKFIYIFVHKLFDGYKQEVESRELVQHCILLSNSLPNKLSTRCNMDAKYDGFKMDKIIEEMKKVTIRISFVIPKLLIFFFFFCLEQHQIFTYLSKARL